ncbi:MAG: dephospho-CoA kinase [Bryobacterales bacterium]|nr:dephospho-CoA kinase [Bryobacterales bacterium]
MRRVGLTGGLASGKSFVGDTLASLGCALLKADDVGHRLLQPGGAAYPLVVAAFGDSILQPDGAIERSHLAALVFGHPERLKTLNAIIHPLVFEEEERFFERLEKEAPTPARPGEQPPPKIGVVEAAILIETGNHLNFEKIWVAWCPREVQIERAVHRGLTREQALSRLEHQMPLDEKLRFADEVIDTSGSKDDTVALVEAAHRRLLENPGRLLEECE